MKTNQSRRTFIKTSIKAGVGISILNSTLYSCLSKEEVTKKLNILILGGTSFLGPHQIAYAIGRGHNITTFTRGKTKPSIYKDLYDQVEQLVGDRENNLKALENRKWDVVIDNSGRQVEWTKKTASLLKDHCDLYVYTSSTGVFYPYINSEFKETSKVALKIPEGVDEDAKYQYDYGVMKANSELEAIKQFGADRTIVIRPTYMLGPADRTNRFMHWPLRLKRGEQIMLPGKKEDKVQYVDVRDVAEWMIRLIESKKAGTYNAVGPKQTQNLQEFAEESKKTFNTESSFVNINDYDFLVKNNIFYAIPWVIPTDNHAGTSKINNSKAIKNGLTFKPLQDTIKDTYDWWMSDAVSQERRDKFKADPNSIIVIEQAIIEKWKAFKT